MAEKPPAWTESSGQIGQVPLALSQDVDTTGVAPGSGQDAHVLAAQIVRQQQPVINRFVSQQRRQIEIGAKDVHKAVLPLNGMDVYYSHVQGLERMHYHISPQAEAPVPALEALEEPRIPKPPEVPEPEVPEIPKPPEAPELPAPPEVPEVPEPPKEKEPEKEEELKKPEPEQPDFLIVDMPCFLAVEFGDGAN